jgi:(R,R)-butanediol dehydrogenase/meso-butanediol dehydrogenase/diacetyl reductase
VKVVELNPYRLELLRTLGLATIDAGSDIVSAVNEWTDGDGADVAFEVTGNPVAVRHMTDVVRVWGTVSIIAIHAEPATVNLYPIFARELNVQGSRLYTRAAWEEAIHLASTGSVPLSPLISRRIPLDDLQKGMEEALTGGAVMKVVVDLEA